MIGNRALVSVVMCCYNAERYIKQTIDSVLNQTFRDFEFIVWNDGSTDSTEAIIKSYKDERIRYFYHENAGLGQSLKWACEKVTSEYIARIDADDICVENRLEKEYHFMQSHPKCALVFSGAILIDENDCIIGQTIPYTRPSIIRKLIKRFDSIIMHPSVMIRKSSYFKTQQYPLVEGFEDTVLWYQLIDQGDFCAIKEPLIKYRFLSNSLSHGYRQTKYRRVIVELRKIIIKEFGMDTFDNNIHSALFSQAKVEYKKQKNPHYHRKKIDEKLLNRLSRLLGERSALTLICFIKNIYAMIKY